MIRPTCVLAGVVALALGAQAGCGGAPPARAEVPVPLAISLVVRPAHPPIKLPAVVGHEAPFERKPIAKLPTTPGAAATALPARPTLPAPPADPVVSDRELATARAAVARARGAQRLASKGALAHLLALRARAAPADVAARDVALAAFADLATEPGYALTAGGVAAPPDVPVEVWLFDHAGLLLAADRLADAQRAVVRLFKDHPGSPLAPEAYLLLGEAAFFAGEMPLAVDAYEHVVQFDGVRMLDYARYKLGWAQLDSGNPGGALSAWTAVAHSPDATLRRAALDDLATAYAMAGKADTAWNLFSSLEPERAVARLELLADRYLDLDKDLEAATVLKAALAAEPDPARACADRVAAIRAEAPQAHRDVILDDAHALAAHLVGDACRDAADATLGDLAWAWHDEQRVTKAHPEPIIALWEVVAALSPTPRRQAAALANRADLLWRLAGQRWVVDVWLAAAAGSAAAAAATPTDPELARDAVDAWDNAARVARRDAGSTAKIAPKVLAQIRAGLAAAGHGPAATHAAEVAALLR
jgi:TolA-binding protein